jgi:hypothetical protein
MIVDPGPSKSLNSFLGVSARIRIYCPLRIFDSWESQPMDIHLPQRRCILLVAGPSGISQLRHELVLAGLYELGSTAALLLRGYHTLARHFSSHMFIAEDQCGYQVDLQNNMTVTIGA